MFMVYHGMRVRNGISSSCSSREGEVYYCYYYYYDDDDNVERGMGMSLTVVYLVIIQFQGCGVPFVRDCFV